MFFDNILHLCILIYCSWYLKAQQIAPKNGRPYNQLALLAVYTVSVKLLIGDKPSRFKNRLKSLLLFNSVFPDTSWYYQACHPFSGRIDSMFALHVTHSCFSSLLYRSESWMLSITTCVAWQLPTPSWPQRKAWWVFLRKQSGRCGVCVFLHALHLKTS